MRLGLRLRKGGLFAGFGLKGIIFRLILRTILFYVLTAIFVSWLGLPAATLAGVFEFIKSVF